MGTRNPSQRIKGQEVNVLCTRDGALEDTLTDIQSFNLEAQFEIKNAGYLGEKTNRKDFIFNGGKFDLELHLHKQDYFKYFVAVMDKAQRNTPDVIFNITGVFAFPNGETPTLLLADVVFGPMPLNVTARGDYVKVKLEGEVETITVTTS